MTLHAVPPASSLAMLDGIAAVADRYDGYILDLWGTIHDGYRPLPGALDALERLRAADKRMVILSNAPRRAENVTAAMERIGVPAELCDGVLSSGEAAWRALEAREGFYGALGARYLMIGPPEDDSAIAGLPYERTEDVAAADFLLAIGPYERGDAVDRYDTLLDRAADRDLPMICANPDLVVLRGEARELCAGAIAARYEDKGGRVRYLGKPHPEIYAMTLPLLGVDDRPRILAVGDSLRTDVAGASAAGIDALLVTGGIHAEALGVRPFDMPAPEALEALCNQERHHPRWVAPAFRW